MTLFTKCFTAMPRPGDGVRISVLSSHVLSDGTPDPRITKGLFDEHYPVLAPSPGLLLAIKNGMTPTAFERAYSLELRRNVNSFRVMAEIGGMSLTEDVTLLSFEREPPHFHVKILTRMITNIISLVRVEHSRG